MRSFCPFLLPLGVTVVYSKYTCGLFQVSFLMNIFCPFTRQKNKEQDTELFEKRFWERAVLQERRQQDGGSVYES